MPRCFWLPGNIRHAYPYRKFIYRSISARYKNKDFQTPTLLSIQLYVVGYAVGESVPLDAQQRPILRSFKAISPAVMSLCHNSVLEFSSPEHEKLQNCTNWICTFLRLTIDACNVNASLVQLLK